MRARSVIGREEVQARPLARTVTLHETITCAEHCAGRLVLHIAVGSVTVKNKSWPKMLGSRVASRTAPIGRYTGYRVAIYDSAQLHTSSSVRLHSEKFPRRSRRPRL